MRSTVSLATGRTHEDSSSALNEGKTWYISWLLISYSIHHKLCFRANTVRSGGCSAEWDQAAAGGGRGGSVTAVKVNTGLWLADNVNTELWLVADTVTQGSGVTTNQSASPGYSDTEVRDELNDALRQESENLKWSWVLTKIFHVKYDLNTWPDLEYDFSWMALLLSVIGASFVRTFCNTMQGRSVKVELLEPNHWALKSKSQKALPQKLRASSWPQKHKYFSIDISARRNKHVEFVFVTKA